MNEDSLQDLEDADRIYVMRYYNHTYYHDPFSSQLEYWLLVVKYQKILNKYSYGIQPSRV